MQGKNGAIVSCREMDAFNLPHWYVQCILTAGFCKGLFGDANLHLGQW